MLRLTRSSVERYKTSRELSPKQTGAPVSILVRELIVQADMIAERRGEVGRGKGGGGLEVIVHVEHVGEQRLGGRVDLLHLVLHLNVLESEVLPRPGHPEEPGDPLEEDHSDLKVRRLSLQLLLSQPYPVWHVLVSVSFPVVVVEDHDGGDHAAGHHEHDAVEVGSLTGV